eukprot:CAMPEP_0170451986 /NCGR_PEP_ID=MMETSP0123-20130129/1046_1 /TAXON_ID=182087 /ORGANISM="Favella ehrenbergii, Strain Fehren 1" /LENGTH=35 /DNA_ID= /DNA_START= /DNA_END= /DNA_ORIENTATION=
MKTPSSSIRLQSWAASLGVVAVQAVSLSMRVIDMV